LFLAVAWPLHGAEDDASRADLKRMQGMWRAVSGIRDGFAIPRSELRHLTRSIKDDVYTISVESPESVLVIQGKMTLDATQQPKTIDVVRTDGPSAGQAGLGIYEFDESRLRICVVPPGQARPTEMTAAEGSGRTLLVWRPLGTAEVPVPAQPAGLDSEGVALIKRVGQLYENQTTLICRGIVSTRHPGSSQTRVHRVALDFTLGPKQQLALQVRDIEQPARTLIVRSDGQRQVTIAPGLQQHMEGAAASNREELVESLTELGHVNTGALLQNLLATNPAETLLDTVTHCEYLGLEQLESGPAHRVRCTQPDLTWELWAAEQGDPVVLKFRSVRVTALSTDLTEEIYDAWQLGGTLPDETFAIEIPAGSRQVDEFASP
jgi:uncharacterized protein (TIGR03067 family)